jgi:predicted nucleic-acid-binding protein
MRGLDTNVLLRIVDRTDGVQSEQAERLVKETSDGAFLINPIVVAEFAWTLSRTYRVPRAEIAQWLRYLIEAPEFVVENERVVEEAIAAFEAGRADFADCLIGAMNLASGCSTTVTFDKDAAAVTTLFSPVPN